MAEEPQKPHQATVKSVEEAHRPVAASDGGACLTRDTSEYRVNWSCSHRWQARLSAEDHAQLYDWPKYKRLHDEGKPVQTSKQWGFPWWYSGSLDAPAKNAWDVAGENFTKKCYTPYWHNAHHLVPNGVLKEAIGSVGKDLPSPSLVRLNVKQGLLEQKYNLNHKANMIILPMDRSVGAALKLPVHLKTIWERSHGEYSKNVRSNVDQFFRSIKDAIRPPCTPGKKPDYALLKRQLEGYSATLFAAVSGAGAIDLDAMKEADFAPRPGAPPGGAGARGGSASAGGWSSS